MLRLGGGGREAPKRDGRESSRSQLTKPQWMYAQSQASQWHTLDQQSTILGFARESCMY